MLFSIVQFTCLTLASLAPNYALPMRNLRRAKAPQNEARWLQTQKLSSRATRRKGEEILQKGKPFPLIVLSWAETFSARFNVLVAFSSVGAWSGAQQGRDGLPPRVTMDLSVFGTRGRLVSLTSSYASCLLFAHVECSFMRLFPYIRIYTVDGYSTLEVGTELFVWGFSLLH